MNKLKDFFKDIKQMLFLIKGMFISFFRGNLDDALFIWALIKIHWAHTNKKLN